MLILENFLIRKAFLFKLLNTAECLEPKYLRSLLYFQVFINFSKQQKELAEDLEETVTEVDRDTDNSNTFQHDYDEPLILLSDRNDQSPGTSYDSDDEILLA